MNTVIRHIEYLISRSSCVIVPGLGAILACYQSAQVDTENCRITPPSRKYSFNSQLCSNDGTLAFSISRKQNISYDDAEKLIAEEVDTMQRQLRTQGNLQLGRIGTLKYDAANQSISFIPYPKDVISVNSAWLPTIDASEPQSPQIQIEPYAKWKRFARIAASIAILLCVWFLASTPLSIDNAALASLSPHVTSVESQIVEDTTPQMTAYTSAKDLFIDVDTAESNGIKRTQQALKEIDAIKYYVIVASFSNEKDAQKFISQHQNPAMDILVKDGRTRVYAASFSTEKEAYAAIHNKTIGFADAWVCKR